MPAPGNLQQIIQIHLHPYQQTMVMMTHMVTTALWEYKGGQEDIRKISGKTHRKPHMEKCIRFTYRFYLGLIFISFNNQYLVHFNKIKF